MTRRVRGFTLVEVLVALVIIALGLLGVAKLQAVALSSTGTAGKRSIAALEAAGMAAAMHADRGYWTSATIGTTTVSNNSFVSTDASLNPAANCRGLASPGCVQADMASYDLTQWATSLNSTLGSTYQAIITCTPPAAGPPQLPAACYIQLQWTENSIGVGTTQANAAQANAAAGNPAAIQTPTYVLYVTP